MASNDSYCLSAPSAKDKIIHIIGVNIEHGKSKFQDLWKTNKNMQLPKEPERIFFISDPQHDLAKTCNRDGWFTIEETKAERSQKLVKYHKYPVRRRQGQLTLSSATVFSIRCSSGAPSVSLGRWGDGLQATHLLYSKS